MMNSMRDEGGPGTSGGGGEPSVDYRIREVEARLARRLDAAESQRVQVKWLARLMGAGVVALLIALVFVVTMAAGDHESLTAGSLHAEELVLRDAAGVTRGRLGIDEDGRVQFSLSDRDGRARMRLAVLGDGSPGLTITDAETRPRAVLGYLPDGTTSLVFADAEGISRAVVGLGPDGSTHALFADRTGQIRTLVGVGADGVPSVSLVEGDQVVAAPDTVSTY
ncbi:MAG: hypothetical protein R3314_02435 [Longimicrobiales bacterium]|nr:hypothetical protein [Longimicrobiales bacterium]